MSATSQPATKSTTAATSHPTDLLEELKEQLAGPLLTAISDQFSSLQKTVISYQNQLEYAELKIRVLEERLRQQRIAKYGPGSEKLSDEQLELLELEPGVSGAEVEAESQRESLPSSRKPRRKHPGRQTLPENLPRVEKIVVCTPEQCRCGGCGGETTVIGYEESEQLGVDPAKYFVLVTKREKRACKQCEERGVSATSRLSRVSRAR